MSEQQNNSSASRDDEDENIEPEKKVSLWAVTKSVFSAMFGVQSSKNRERDFTQGKAHHFIIIGIIATVLFILTLVTIVSMVS